MNKVLRLVGFLIVLAYLSGCISTGARSSPVLIEDIYYDLNGVDAQDILDGIYLRLDASNDPMGNDFDMGDHQIVNVDNITFHDTSGQIAGIPNQYLINKNVEQTLTKNWTWSSEGVRSNTFYIGAWGANIADFLSVIYIQSPLYPLHIITGVYPNNKSRVIFGTNGDINFTHFSNPIFDENVEWVDSQGVKYTCRVPDGGGAPTCT